MSYSLTTHNDYNLKLSTLVRKEATLSFRINKWQLLKVSKAEYRERKVLFYIWGTFFPPKGKNILIKEIPFIAKPILYRRQNKLAKYCDSDKDKSTASEKESLLYRPLNTPSHFQFIKQISEGFFFFPTH